MTTEWSGILLAGAPGTGKRTTVFALGTLSRRYVRFPALSSARESSLDIEYANESRLAELRSWAQVFHEVTRDGAALVHDRERLGRVRDAGGLPVVTIDAAASLDAFERESPGWLAVLLHIPFDAARCRAARKPWERAERDLARAASRCTLAVRTDRLPPIDVAQLIHRAAQAGG